jgi:NADPH-dependent 2,4-dienoyl-CoA reductase/sulfur reductase-like enzyme
VSVSLESRELVIVGGGPAGMAAALEARRADVQVTLIEERATLGGQIYKQLPRAFDVRQPRALGKEYVAGRTLVEHALGSGAELLTGHAVWNVWGRGPFDVAAYQQGSRAVTLRTEHLILAAGAYDRPVPFPGWTLPGVLTAGGAQSMVKIQQIYPGDRILMAGSGPLILAFSVQLHKLGANVVGVLEAAPQPGPGTAARLLRGALGGNLPLLREGVGYLAYLRRHDIPLLYGHAIARAEGADQVTGAVAVRVDHDWRPIVGTERLFDVDTVCIGYGFLPSLEIPRLLGCALRYDENQGGHVPVRDADLQSSVPGLFVVGDGAGVAGSAVAIEEGRIAGIVAARRLGRLSPASAEERLGPRRRWLAQLERFRAALDAAYRIGPGIYEWATDETVVCRCEEVTVGEVRRHIRPGSRDPNAVKSLTRIGMGLCQGHSCSQQVGAIFAQATGRSLLELPPLSPRPPVRPVTIGLIADMIVPEMPPHVVRLPEVEVGNP